MPAPPLVNGQTFIPQTAFAGAPQGFKIGNFNVNQALTDVAGLTNRIAANFSPDPRVRQVRQEGIQQQTAQQQQLAQAQIQASVERFKSIAQMIQGIAQQTGGQVPGSIQKMVDNETKILGTNLQQAGMDPQQALQYREMALAGAQMPGPQGEGFSLSPGAVRFDAQGNPIAAVPSAEPSGYTLAPGSTRYDAQGQPVVTAPGQPSGVNIQFGAGAFAPVQESRVTELQKNVQQSEENLAEIRRLRGMVEGDVGEAATGVRGVVSETVGGLSQQFLGTEGAYGPLGGPPLADVTTIRTQSQTLMGRMVAAVTGDDSGRYTERDNERVRAATRALDPNASVQQIQAALQNLEEIEVRAGARDRVALRGLDIRSRQGVKEYAKALAAASPGMTPEEAVAEALKDLGLNF